MTVIPLQDRTSSAERGNSAPGPRDPDGEPLFIDVAAVLRDGLAARPKPALLTRDDGHRLFYRAKVNVLFGDPESGKTWIALAAVVEALRNGWPAAVVDLDHNGPAEILSRLQALGAGATALGDPTRFLLAEPDHEGQLHAVVDHLRGELRPGVAVVDSLGELLPMLGMSSNSPDDYTSAHRRVLSRLTGAGTAVIAIDHLPKSDDARQHGQTGTMAKRRAVNGVSIRVHVAEPFAPGRGGAATMTVQKDRPGGVREHCPAGRTAVAGKFVMTAQPDGTLRWKVLAPVGADDAEDQAEKADLAALDAMVPGPKTKRDVQDRLGWGSTRAQTRLKTWRDLRKQSDAGQ